MAWIESHQELRDHPKTKRAARHLGIGTPQMVGHLQFLWWWSVDYAEDGDLSRFDSFDVADAAGWDGDAEAFVAALIECGPSDSSGFLDADWKLHDWDDYAGKLVAQRQANRERQRRFREKQAENKTETETDKERNANVTRDKRVSNGATVPYPTEPNKTEEEKIAPKTARTTTAVDKPKRNLIFETMYELWLGTPYQPPGECTDDERGRLNRAAGQLARKSDATPDEIARRWHEAEARAGPEYPVTPQTLTKSWTDLAHARSQHSANGRRPRGSDTIDAARQLFDEYAGDDPVSDRTLAIDR